MNRKCKKCGKTKTLEDFPINNTFASGVQRKHSCNTCRGHQSKVRAKLHKENKRPKLIICPICDKETHKVVLDHNHSTGKFRGWLCNDCNNALGKFNDDIDFLKKAIKYLKKKLD